MPAGRVELRNETKPIAKAFATWIVAKAFV